MSVLERELEYYRLHLDELLESHAGRIALIKGDELVGVYDTPQEAIAEGTRRFGLEPFLVRTISRAQDEVAVPALTLGLLRADFS